MYPCKKYTVISLFSFLSACSALDPYQPPNANISGKVTNPYATDPFQRRIPDEKPVKIKTSKKNRPVKLPAPQPPEPFEPIITQQPVFIPEPTFSPAVVALLSQSEKNSRAGDLASSVSLLERALRIEPRNPALTYKLAELRVKQSKPRLAENLAKKAALLAGKNKMLKKKSWLLISKARQMQNNFHGAKEAKLKAEGL